VDNLAKISLDIAKDIQTDIPEYLKPPAEGFKAETAQIIPLSYVRNTRGYIEKLVNQINGCYEKGWFDACAVMMRRLCEVLIIEVYEGKGLAANIKDGNGNYFMMETLIKSIINETSWTLNKHTRNGLPKVNLAGNLSAHGIRYNPHAPDIDLLISEFRVIVQDLLGLSGIK